MWRVELLRCLYTELTWVLTDTSQVRVCAGRRHCPICPVRDGKARHTMPSSYEELRTARIAANALVLSQLGVDLGTAAKPAKKSAPRPRKRRAVTVPAEGSRRSIRTRGAAPIAYFAPPEPMQDESLTDERAAKREQIAKGWRLRDGRWRGERFGAVTGVAEGTVFGAGDYWVKRTMELLVLAGLAGLQGITASHIDGIAETETT